MKYLEFIAQDKEHFFGVLLFMWLILHWVVQLAKAIKGDK